MNYRERFSRFLKNNRVRTLFFTQTFLALLGSIALAIISSSSFKSDLITNLLSILMILFVFSFGFEIFLFILISPFYLYLFIKIEKVEANDKIIANPEKILELQKKNLSNGNSTFFVLLGVIIFSNLILKLGDLSPTIRDNYLLSIFLNFGIYGLFIAIGFVSHLFTFQKLMNSYLGFKILLKGLLKFDLLQIVFSFLFLTASFQTFVKCDCLDQFVLLVITNILLILFTNIEVLVIWFVKKLFYVDNHI